MAIELKAKKNVYYVCLDKLKELPGDFETYIELIVDDDGVRAIHDLNSKSEVDELILSLTNLRNRCWRTYE